MKPSRVAVAVGLAVLAATFLCVAALAADTCPGESDARGVGPDSGQAWS